MVTVCFNVSIDYHWLPLYSPMMSCCARITFIFKESLHWEKFTVIFRPASSNRYLEEVHWGQRDTRHQEPSQCYQYNICEAAVLQRQDSQVSQGGLRAARGLAVEFVGCSCQTVKTLYLEMWFSKCFSVRNAVFTFWGIFWVFGNVNSPLPVALSKIQKMK